MSAVQCEMWGYSSSVHSIPASCVSYLAVLTQEVLIFFLYKWLLLHLSGWLLLICVLLKVLLMTRWQGGMIYVEVVLPDCLMLKYLFTFSCWVIYMGVFFYIFGFCTSVLWFSGLWYRCHTGWITRIIMFFEPYW
jgi:hypothetical protein